jgi:isoleucyl-tRNA synthetase
LTVGPKIDYVLVQTFNQYTFLPTNVILAKNLVGKQFGRGFFESENVDDFENYAAVPPSGARGLIPFKVIAKCKGSDLVGIKYEQLLKYALPYQNPENAFRVIAGDFVTTEDGTGIVHTAPTFGAESRQRSHARGSAIVSVRRKWKSCSVSRFARQISSGNGRICRKIC